MPKKVSKLKEGKSVHGKLEDTPKEKKVYRTLDQIFGDSGLHKYNTLEVAEYEKQLTEMNLSDLQSHASKVGIFPNDNRDRLTKSLLREFNLYAAQYITADKRTKEKGNSKNVSTQAKKILSEGK